MLALYVVKEAPDADHYVRDGLIDKEIMTKCMKAPHSEDVKMVITGGLTLVIALCRPSIL